jgi:hypothetical protein
MVKGFLNVASSLLYFILSNPNGIAKHARLCMQLADSGGNIAAGALSRTTTLSFLLLEFLFCF